MLLPSVTRCSSWFSMSQLPHTPTRQPNTTYTHYRYTSGVYVHDNTYKGIAILIHRQVQSIVAAVIIAAWCICCCWPCTVHQPMER